METISCHTVMTHAVSSGEHREKLNYTWKRQRDILFLDFLEFAPSVNPCHRCGHQPFDNNVSCCFQEQLQ
jgi:hypothetical protein